MRNTNLLSAKVRQTTKVTLILRGRVQKQGRSAEFTHKAIIEYITHVYIFAQFLESLLDFWHNQLKHTDQYAVCLLT